ncbi:MAG: isocitrate/isopropylmalate family dehydrogenase [Rickettsiales bacterium]
MSTPITVAYGNGIGPEIMDATLLVLREADAKIAIETIEIGQRVYDMTEQTGILPHAWDSLIRTRILLKAPTPSTSPQGGMSCSEVIRDSFELEDTHHSSFFLEEHPDIISHAYINEHFALFEPAHEMADELKGKNSADPSAMLFTATSMLKHINEQQIADNILNAWLCTIEDGLVPNERHKWGKGLKKLGTNEFAEAICERLGKTPSRELAASV